MEVIERILEITRGKPKERVKQSQYSSHYLLFAQALDLNMGPFTKKKKKKRKGHNRLATLISTAPPITVISC
jgi:hypothetical protein